MPNSSSYLRIAFAYLIDALFLDFDFSLRDVALKINPNWEFNKDLEIPKPCRFLNTNFCFAKTSLNPMLSAILELLR